MQLAEYAVQARIAEEPAFAWWVPHTLKKQNRIISKLKSKYWFRTHKFGIKIPKNAEEARAFDAENGNTLWWDAILKEMKNVRPAFEVWEKGIEEIPLAYQEIKCHLIFDVKRGEISGVKLVLLPAVTQLRSPILYLHTHRSYLEIRSGWP